MEKIYSESAVVTKRRRLIRVVYLLTTAGDIKRYYCLGTVESAVHQYFELTMSGIKHHIIANKEVNKEMEVVTQKI